LNKEYPAGVSNKSSIFEEFVLYLTRLSFFLLMERGARGIHCDPFLCRVGHPKHVMCEIFFSNDQNHSIRFTVIVITL